MKKELTILFEKYNFDYIYINPKNIPDLDFLFLRDETIIDFKGKPHYLGSIKINEVIIEVYFNKKITPGDVIFKYKSIKKERMIKLSSIIDNSVD